MTLPGDILINFDSNITDQADGDITIFRHTGSKGEGSYNQKLSEERDTAVLNALNDSGVKNERLHAKGKGASKPIAKNVNSDGSDNPDGRQENQRVEVIVKDFNEQ